MCQITFSSALFLKHWLNYIWNTSRQHISMTCLDQPRNVWHYKITHSLFPHYETKWVKADSWSRRSTMKIFTKCTIDGSPLFLQNTCAFPLPKNLTYANTGTVDATFKSTYLLVLKISRAQKKQLGKQPYHSFFFLNLNLQLWLKTGQIQSADWYMTERSRTAYKSLKTCDETVFSTGFWAVFRTRKTYETVSLGFCGGCYGPFYRTNHYSINWRMNQ